METIYLSSASVLCAYQLDQYQAIDRRLDSDSDPFLISKGEAAKNVSPLVGAFGKGRTTKKFIF